MSKHTCVRTRKKRNTHQKKSHYQKLFVVEEIKFKEQIIAFSNPNRSAPSMRKRVERRMVDHPRAATCHLHQRISRTHERHRLRVQRDLLPLLPSLQLLPGGPQLCTPCRSRQNGRTAEWQNGRMADWQNGRLAEWQNGRTERQQSFGVAEF